MYVLYRFQQLSLIFNRAKSIQFHNPIITYHKESFNPVIKIY